MVESFWLALAGEKDTLACGVDVTVVELVVPVGPKSILINVGISVPSIFCNRIISVNIQSPEHTLS